MLRKKYQICKNCARSITGVEKWDGDVVYCCKCFRAVEKAIQFKKDLEAKNWYNPNWTDDEYFHYVYDHFC